MTPERKEEIKRMMEEEYARPDEPYSGRFIANAPQAIAELLTALEEAEQRNKMSEGNYELLKTAFVRELTDERVAIAAADWLDCSPHERTEADGVILARYARKAMKELTEAQQTIDRLTEALGSARSTMEDALSIGEARYKDFDTQLCPWADLSDGVASISVALGEGSKESTKTEPHSCGEGGECSCIDCGGTNSRTWVCEECQKKREAKGHL